jgi:hypothetical protein
MNDFNLIKKRVKMERELKHNQIEIVIENEI